MIMRTTISTVTVKEPFLLTGIAGNQPAGNYEIELQEQLIDNTAFLAYRRMSTQIRLQQQEAHLDYPLQMPIDPAQLEKLLAIRRPAVEPVMRADPDYLIVS